MTRSCVGSVLAPSRLFDTFFLFSASLSDQLRGVRKQSDLLRNWISAIDVFHVGRLIFTSTFDAAVNNGCN